jgi:hypothetical protein
MAPTLLALALVLFSQSPTANQGLKIVVLEGEDAVNVVQQKTAVRPLIEVRDRNNLPVADVTVTFAIQGNAATFAGGVQTFSVVTNAAGQAAAAAVNPVASGAVQIQVQAALQGQTALATITQTNVMTAAQAAAASGGASGSATGSGAGSGGISGPVIGGVAGAAAAAGAYLALSGKEGEAPPLSVSVGPVSGGIREVTEFTFNVSGGSGANFSWDFGDGNTATGASVRHIFPREGQFVVTVRDGQAATTTVTVPIGSMTGSFVSPWSQGRFVLVLTQSGTSIQGQWVTDVTNPSSGIASSTSTVLGTLTTPLGFTFTQNGECLRELTGSANATLTTLTMGGPSRNLVCGQGLGYNPFTRQ